MLQSYSNCGKQVYGLLINQHEAYVNFTFSLRQKGSKSSELDYFIRTERSNYLQ